MSNLEVLCAVPSRPHITVLYETELRDPNSTKFSHSLEGSEQFLCGGGEVEDCLLMLGHKDVLPWA